MKLDPAKKRTLISKFRKLYPNPGSELNFRSPYELVVSVSLSAQCTDKKVNDVTPHLFRRYPDFKKLASARLADVEKIIRPINYYKTKSKNLIAMANMIIDSFGGDLPKIHKELTELPGVGNKTANVVLGEQGHAKTLPVDTHVFRVSRRLGLTDGKNPLEVEEDLKKLFQSSLWRELHHWLIFHGRRVCKAQRPLCGECTLAPICPSRSN